MGVHVLQALEARPVVRTPDRPRLAATALPGVPDPPEAVGSQISVVQALAHGTHNDCMQNHAESLGE